MPTNLNSQSAASLQLGRLYYCGGQSRSSGSTMTSMFNASPRLQSRSSRSSTSPQSIVLSSSADCPGDSARTTRGAEGVRDQFTLKGGGGDVVIQSFDTLSLT